MSGGYSLVVAHWLLTATIFLLQSTGFSCRARASLVVEHGLLLLQSTGFSCRAQAFKPSAFRFQQLWNVGSVVVAPGALRCRLRSCGPQTQLLHSMWDLPGSGIEPVSPALAGGFFTAEPPWKAQV